MIDLLKNVSSRRSCTVYVLQVPQVQVRRGLHAQAQAQAQAQVGLWVWHCTGSDWRWRRVETLARVGQLKQPQYCKLRSGQSSLRSGLS